MSARRRPGRVVTAACCALAAGTALAGPAAHAAGRPGLDGPRPDPALLERCTGAGPVVCTYPELPPGHYDVTVMLGDRHGPAGTEVQTEARRLMVAQVDTADGELARRTFTVNVRDPESQQNQPAGEGTPGLTLTFTGDARTSPGSGSGPPTSARRAWRCSATPPSPTRAGPRTPAGASGCPRTSVSG
ncbi:hypothetical protein ACH436_03155 [Isoptericola sp. NPDC019693]|uniref:hypothetical protein n=1 Tax=Isoptericola sp. NPDC019693 TaxID=3364009 RepID=UPI00379316BF